jgi:hypothetical protein
MIDIVAAVNDDDVLTNNLKRSPILDAPDVRLVVQRGFPSAALAYRAAVRQCSGEVVVFAHQDVYLPAHWREQLLRSVERLSTLDPDWAVLGVYGVTEAGSDVGRVWSSGLSAVFGSVFAEPVAVASIDEVVIVLRRASGVEFDAGLPGFHLYGTDLVQTARAQRKSCYVIHAPVIHNSRPCRYLGKDYFEAYDFVAAKWRNCLPIANNVARIVGPGLPYWQLRARHLLNALRHWRKGRRVDTPSRDCVVLARQLGFE